MIMMKFIWFVGDEIVHEVEIPYGKPLAGLMWDNRRPDSYIIPKLGKAKTEVERMKRLSYDNQVNSALARGE